MGVAIVLCVAVGVALKVYSQNLPQRQQEGLETVIGALAVGMVTYMVVWMRRNSRNLKGQLEGLAADAIDGTSGAGRAMVLMAFLAVIREGVETVVFVLAAFNEAGSGRARGCRPAARHRGRVVLGYGIYRGGVRLNLSKFFRATGLVLVLVAAGIVVNALHTAHEAGWLDVGQSSPVDLDAGSSSPGTVQASLLTGMLGMQAAPGADRDRSAGCSTCAGRAVRRLAAGRGRPGRALLAAAAPSSAALAALAALVLALVAPAAPCPAAGDPRRRGERAGRVPRGARPGGPHAGPRAGPRRRSRAGRRLPARPRSGTARARRPSPPNAVTAAPVAGTGSAGPAGHARARPRSPGSTAGACRSGSAPPARGGCAATYRDTATVDGLARHPHATRRSTCAWAEHGRR